MISSDIDPRLLRVFRVVVESSGFSDPRASRKAASGRPVFIGIKRNFKTEGSFARSPYDNISPATAPPRRDSCDPLEVWSERRSAGSYVRRVVVT